MGIPSSSYRGSDASEIDVEVHDAVATLTGNVEDWRARRTAERLSEGVAGVDVVLNRLQVDESSEGESTDPDN